jgi:hypothetical protein
MAALRAILFEVDLFQMVHIAQDGGWALGHAMYV